MSKIFRILFKIFTTIILIITAVAILPILILKKEDTDKLEKIISKDKI